MTPLSGGKTGRHEVAFHHDLDGFGFLGQRDRRLLKVVLEHVPRLLLLLVLLAVPVDALLGLILQPVFGEHGPQGLDVGRLATPSSQVPLLEDLVNDLPDEEGRAGGRGQLLDIAEEELQPTRLERLEPGGADR